ncbi:MAG: 16S rRNA (guanine(527)-N(7))-methyltransferase RsmG [Oscillatoriales cyanobacterium]|nr:MAG: 16S rRNA (guanine(527)-N(7))-methyltransferase RsmG [Oscillatoriales cyanobacterium]
MTLSPAPLLPDAIEPWQSTTQWQPSPEQQAQFQRLYELVLAGNQRMNLTRITEPMDFWEKHLWDSMRGLLSPVLQAALAGQDPHKITVADLGTGGGFPGLPGAIAFPEWRWLLMDSTRKKIQFVAETITELGLTNAKTECDRAEQFVRRPGPKPNFQLVTLRAVGAANLCAHYALPMLAPRGIAVLYRGHWSAEEAATLDDPLAQWGAKILGVDAFKTPVSGGDRHCVYLQKTD